MRTVWPDLAYSSRPADQLLLEAKTTSKEEEGGKRRLVDMGIGGHPEWYDIVPVNCLESWRVQPRLKEGGNGLRRDTLVLIFSSLDGC